MKGNSPLHGLGLAQLLGMLAASQQPEAPSEELERLLNTDFKPIDEEDRNLLADGLQRLVAMDPNDIAGVFISVLHRDKADEPCGGCGEVHPRPNGSKEDGLRQRVIAIGYTDVLLDSISVALDGLAKRAAQQEVQVFGLSGGDLHRL